MTRRVLLVLAVAALAGCTALLGIDKDYQLDDASSSDAPIDTAPGDADAQDAGPDAHYCAALSASPDAGKIALCDDFDLGKPLGFGWTDKNIAVGSSLTIDSDAAVSKPSSLLAWTPLGDGGSYAMAAIGYAHAQSPAMSSVSVEVDIRFDDANGPTNDAVQPIEIGLGKWSSTPEWRVRINAYPDHAELEEYENAPDGGNTWDWAGLTQYFIVGQWVHVTMRVDLTAHTVDVWFDSTQVLTAHPLKFLWPVGQSGEVAVGNLGPRWGYQGPWSIRTDNVVFRVE